MYIFSCTMEAYYASPMCDRRTAIRSAAYLDYPRGTAEIYGRSGWFDRGIAGYEPGETSSQIAAARGLMGWYDREVYREDPFSLPAQDEHC